MATIDQLKMNDGNAVKLGAVRPNPVARGFAPNSFGDAAAANSNPQVRVTPSAAINQPAAPGLGATPAPTARGFTPAPLGQPKLGAVRHHPTGKITGKGTGTSDQVPIDASNGEFILKAAAVKKIGIEALEALNAIADKPGANGGGVRPRGFTPKMAIGGLVDNTGADPLAGQYGHAAVGAPVDQGAAMDRKMLAQSAPAAPAPGTAPAPAVAPVAGVAPPALGATPTPAAPAAPTGQPVSAWETQKNLQNAQTGANSIVKDASQRSAAMDVARLTAPKPASPPVLGAAPATPAFGTATTPATSSLDQPFGAVRKMAAGGLVTDEDRAKMVRQIPATGGAFPAPAADGKENTEVGRNIGNALSALPGASPALSAIRGFAGASKVGGALDAVGGGAGALAAKVAPYGVPAAGLGAVAVASQPATPAAAAVPPRLGATQVPTASAPGTPKAVSQSAASPSESSATTQGPRGALPPSGNQVTRIGNSYSGGPNITGDIALQNGQGAPIAPRGMISARNNQAAENLARADGQTRGFSAGFASDLKIGNQMESDRLAQEAAGFAAQDRQVSVGQAQSDKVDQERAVQRANATLSSIMNTPEARAQKAAAAQTLKAVDERVLSKDRGAIDLRKAGMADQTARRGQDINAGALRSSQQLAQARFGLDARGAGLDNESKSNILAGQKALAGAKTPEERVIAEDNLRALLGKFGKEPAPVRAFAVPGGQELDAKGVAYTRASSVYDPDTKQFIEQGGAKPPLATPQQAHINALKANPKLAADFDAKFGPGAAAETLGQR